MYCREVETYGLGLWRLLIVSVDVTFIVSYVPSVYGGFVVVVDRWIGGKSSS